MDQNNFHLARLIPVDTHSRHAFASAVAKAQAEHDENHLRFYATGQCHLAADSSTLETIDPQTTFAWISLVENRLPRFPRIGWRIGNTSGHVDICIAVPGSLDPINSANARSVQFRLRLHPRSGILVLEAGLDASIKYANDAQEIVPLEPERSLVLIRPITRIFINECEFQIQYTVSKASESAVTGRVADILAKYYGNQLHRLGKVSPTELQDRCGRYAIGPEIGSGTYGDVRYAVDIETGDPRALKDIRVVNKDWRKEIRSEIEILEDLKGYPFILQIYDCWCAKHSCQPKECPGHGAEHWYLATELAMRDLSGIKIESGPDNVLHLLYQTLQGIELLHQKGIMHRDIRLENMLVVSFEPPKALLGDFGKAVRATRHTSTGIGPIPTCAPEVWSRDYTNAIDLWAWAYSVAQLLGYVIEKKDYAKKITRDRLAEIQVVLRSQLQADPIVSGLADLVSNILIWEVSRRMTIEEALNHKVWKLIIPPDPESRRTPELEEPPRKKYCRNSEESSHKYSADTIPFSEEP